MWDVRDVVVCRNFGSVMEAECLFTMELRPKSTVHDVPDALKLPKAG